jgi:hypothetical protein
MDLWTQWKKGFQWWESTTAQYLEGVLKRPAVLTPAGAVLTLSMRARAARSRAMTRMWSRVGLPTKRDQERTLHLLNRLESRLIDLEEKIDALEMAQSQGGGGK